MGGRRLSPADRKGICKMYEDGVSQHAIASHFRCTRQTVHAVTRHLGDRGFSVGADGTIHRKKRGRSRPTLMQLSLFE